MDNWEYIGDVNPLCGGKWIKVNEGYAEIVELINLGDAAGADGLLLIEHGTVPMPYAGDSLKREIRNALSVWGLSPKDLRGQGKANILLLLAEALWDYGYGDKDRNLVLVSASEYGPGCDKDGWDGAHPDIPESIRLHKEYQDDIAAYIESEILD